MKLKRNLRIRMKGDDVELLQKELDQLGFTIEDKKGYFGKTTQQAVQNFQTKCHINPTGEVDERTASWINKMVHLPGPEPGTGVPSFAVSGHVRQADQSPLQGVTVQAFDKDLRHEEPLGKTTTDKNGRYKITYTSAQFRRAEKETADLIVRVFDQKNRVIAASPIIFNAQRKETVDLIAKGKEYQGLSEYETLIANLEPVLEGIPPADLTEEDIEFLTNETDCNFQHITFLAQSGKLANESNLPPEAFYAFARQGLPTTLSALVKKPRRELRQALRAAIDTNIIPEKLPLSQKEILDQLQQLAAKKRIILDENEGKSTILEHLTTPSRIRNEVEAILTNTLKANLSSPLREPDSPLATMIAAMDIDLKVAKAYTLKEFAEKTLKDKINGELQKEYDDWLTTLPDTTTIGELYNFDQPLDRNPLFGDIVRDSHLRRLLQLTPLADKPDKTDEFLTELYQCGGLYTEFWEIVEEKGIVSPDEIEDAKITFELAPLTMDNLKLVETLKLEDPNIKSLKDLIPYDKDRWLDLFGKYEISPPDSFESEDPQADYAYYLEESITDLFPTGTFFNRVLSIDVGKEDTQNLVKLYSHLGLEEIINDPDTHLDAEIGGIEGEVAKLGEFFDKNPDLDLQHADFYRGFSTAASGEGAPRISWEGFAEADKENIGNQMKVYQRVFRVHPRFETAKILLEDNLDSARKITHIPQNQFVTKYTESSDLDVPTANAIYEKAIAIVENTTLQWAIARDVISPYVENAGFNNTSDDLIQFIKSFPSYQDMFGSLNFCECEKCRSIFSPAAYFLDLMRFIDIYISEPNKYKIPNYLLLETRRDDLWEIPLDCENTNREISYLDIVNEVLEKELKSVSNDKDPYKDLLIGAQHPFNLPFNLPLEQIRIYLEHFNKDLSEIYEIFGELEIKVACEYLHISEELSVLATSTIDREHNTIDFNMLAVLYGIERRSLLSKSPGGLVRVETFLYHTGLTRKELDELLFQNLDDTEKSNLLQQRFYINYFIGGEIPPEYREIPLDIEIRKGTDQAGQPITYEEIVNLTGKKLDRIHRFIRLSRKLRCSFEDLDWILRSIGKTDHDKDIDNNAIKEIAKIKKWQDKFDLPLDVLCSFWYLVKNIGKENPEGPEPQDLFDRVFNHPDISEGQPFNLDYTWNIDGQAGEDIEIRDRLLAALEIYNEDLFLIARKLTDTNTLVLDHNNLSRLYRFSKIPKVLDLSIREFIIVLELIKKKEITSIDDFDVLTEYVEWIKTSGFDVYELHYILTGALNEFVDPGYSDTDTRLLVEDLSKEPKNAIVEKIALEKLGVFFRTQPELLKNVMKFASQTLEDTELLELLSTPIEEDQDIPIKISEFLRSIHSQLLLITKLNLNKTEVESIVASHKEYYGIKDTSDLEIDDIRSLHTFKQLVEDFNDTKNELIEYFNVETGDDGWEKRLEKCKELGDLTGWEKLEWENLENMESCWNKSQFKQLFDKFWSSPILNQNPEYNSVKGVLKLKKCFDLSSYLGIGIDVLINTWLRRPVEETPDEKWMNRTKTARSALEILKAKYSEVEWKEKYEPLNDKIRVLKRDALSAYAIWNIDKDWPDDAPRIKNLRDLYEYLLIDVEMSSCAEISRIKQAISSLQLYIHRCQMNLEVGVDPGSIPEKQWNWMKNYRVWEANRKVFLYPENYIEPELRDNKSPIFKELEDELMQAEVTEESVEKAFRNYLDKFSELANLKTAGSYHDTDTDILYLFGRTNTQPYIYYYRTYENETTWTPWMKVNLSINSEYVSPVYAFGKLFIFWVEITTTSDEELKKKNKATIKYSFYNFNKNWTQPQALCEIENAFMEQAFPIVMEEPEDLENLIINIGYGVKLPTPTWEGMEAYYAFKLYNNLRVSTSTYIQGCDEFFILLRSGPVLSWTLFSGVLVDKENYFMAASHPYDFLLEPQYYNVFDLLDNVSWSSVVKVINNSRVPYKFILDNEDEEFLIEHTYKLIYTTTSHSHVEVFDFQRISTNPVHELSWRLLAGGVDTLLSIESQELEELPFDRLKLNGTKEYDLIDPPYSGGKLDFEGSYGLYYREIFFHIPFLIANRLNANQRFKEAQKWYHYIFDPFASKPGEEELVWRYLPFIDMTLETLKEILSNKAALDVYHKDPFKPHVIARLRLNAYPKAIVMKYIDNLLDWGDYLFAQDTWESITEATMLYILAYDLLGPRPENLRPCESCGAVTYYDIKMQYREGKAIPEFWIELENTQAAADAGNGIESFNNDISPVFCVPENKDFIEYWDRVEDRLYKIRYCMTIKGVVRKLALFQPPISPMVLVRAVAAGRDISSVLSELARPLPHYRFTFMLEKAKSLTSTVQQLGSALLSALEKKDAEELSLLRTTHEKTIQNLTTKVREKQKEEAIESYNALEESKISVETRNTYYTDLIEEGLSENEKLYFESMKDARFDEIMSNVWNFAASIAHLLPNAGAPTAMTYGGREIGKAYTAIGSLYREKASYHTYQGSMSSTTGSHDRRKQDWELQKDISQKDIDQLEKQILAAGYRKQIIEKEIEIHNKNMEQTEEVYNFLKTKFSSKDLYQWMANQLSGLYFQTYKLAYDLAKSAEKAFQYERNTDDTYINFGHWDSLKKGLLSGERLMLELNQLEKAYIDDNARTLEIEKTISLAQINPEALFDLKKEGSCEFELSEELFDFDFPGHYCRKIKTISISIPAIVGPYENIKATLTQESHKTLIKPEPEFVDNSVKLDPGSIYVRSGWMKNQQIAISKGIDDSGMFELNFRDERYLPFEGTGAVSTWILEMPKETNTIDFDSISDVIIHLKYTALFDGGLRTKVEDRLEKIKISGFRILSLKHEFSTAWHKFMNPSTDAETAELEFTVSKKLLPPNIKNPEITEVYMKIDIDPDTLPLSGKLKLSLKPASASIVDFEFQSEDIIKKKISDGKAFSEDKDKNKWIITVNRDNIPEELRKKKEADGDKYYLDPEKLRNIGLIIVYEADWRKE